MFDWVKRLFAKRAMREAAEKLDEKPLEEQLTPGPLLSGSRDVETQPQGAVTGFYRVVERQLQDAIDTKKRTQDAADRITDAIGAPPPEPQKK